MSSSTLSAIRFNVEALERRGILRLRPRRDLIVFPSGFVDVRQTADFFSETSIVAISGSAWGEIFVKQESPTSCGLVTAMNHLKLLADLRRQTRGAGGGSGLNDDDGDGDALITGFAGKTESEAIEAVVGVLPSFSRDGLTLEQMQRLILTHAGRYEIVRNATNDDNCESNAQFSEIDFRDMVNDQIVRFGSVVVNYDMTTLGQSPAGGHLSLVAGLARRTIVGEGKEEGEEKLEAEKWFVLLLDCWPETPVAWVPLESLFRAMNTPDPSNDGKFRGILLRRTC